MAGAYEHGSPCHLGHPSLLAEHVTMCSFVEKWLWCKLICSSIIYIDCCNVIAQSTLNYSSKTQSKTNNREAVLAGKKDVHKVRSNSKPAYRRVNLPVKLITMSNQMN